MQDYTIRRKRAEGVAKIGDAVFRRRCAAIGANPARPYEALGQISEREAEAIREQTAKISHGYPPTGLPAGYNRVGR